jgi:hypothetical protein
MPFLSSSEPGLPAAWIDMLEEIQHALAAALHAATKREHVQEATQPPVDEWKIAWDRLLERLDTLKMPGNPAGNAERLMATEDALSAAQSALDAWLAKAAQAAQRLADQAGRAV